MTNSIKNSQKILEFKELFKLASEENNNNELLKEILNNLKELKKNKKIEIMCFLSNDAALLIVILKFMLALEEQKVRIGPVC